MLRFLLRFVLAVEAKYLKHAEISGIVTLFAVCGPNAQGNANITLSEKT